MEPIIILDCWYIDIAADTEICCEQIDLKRISNLFLLSFK